MSDVSLKQLPLPTLNSKRSAGAPEVDLQVAMADASLKQPLLALSSELPAHAQEVSARDEEHRRAFEDFLQRFHKKYSAAERPVRFKAFCGNYDAIQAHNTDHHGYRMGLNQFSDLTPAEFSRKYARSAAEARAERQSSLPWPSLQTHTYKNLTLPESKDWRTEGAVTSVKLQGECGACWAFTATGALEGAWQIAAKQLLYLSEQQLVDCTPGTSGCGGGNPIPAYAYMKTVNVCTEGSYAYTAKQGVCNTNKCRTAIPEGGVTGWVRVPSEDTQALLEAVAGQPVAVSIDAAPSFQNYKSGVFDQDCPGDMQAINHAVLLVGYGRDGSQDYWLIKNSWGATWGEDGYARLIRGLPGTGVCGIKSQSSYPLVDGSKADPFLNGISVWILLLGVSLVVILGFGIFYVSRCVVRRCKRFRQRRSVAQSAFRTGPPLASGGQQLVEEASVAAGQRAGNSRASRLLSQPSSPQNAQKAATVDPV